jgi:hypothetical protein
LLAKWKSPKYQRSERRKRARERSASCQPTQTLITSYSEFLDKIVDMTNDIVKRHNDVGTELNLAMEKVALTQIDNNDRFTNSSGKLLKMLLEISVANSRGNRNTYDCTIKKFALYLYYIGGRLLYETLQQNLKNVLPAISSLNRYLVDNSTKTEEGIFDYDGLSKFLEDRQLPKVVWICEDVTRVNGKIEYDSRTNKIIEFTLPLVNGFPKTDEFLATSSRAMKESFSRGLKTNYAYVIMAQPLSPVAPAYCLAICGTDNRFTANDVMQRWQEIRANAEKRGNTVLGFSSDGDTRLLKAMRQCAILPPDKKNCEWQWYQSGYKLNDCFSTSYVQDTVHIATKLRTRFLNNKVDLRMGDYIVCPAHVQQLISTVSKEKHFLTKNDLQPEDKMNFLAAEKVCSPDVIRLLEGIPESEATRAYLNLMHLAISSYLEPKISIKHRLYNIWYVVFFLRIWRKWLMSHSNFKLANNFITSNCYTCVELNAHALVNIICNFRDNPLLTNEMFLPYLFSSQPCEKIFRTTRSMTSTLSTVVNYSIKDIMQRLDRIKAINNILHDLKDVFTFPREVKKRISSTDVNVERSWETTIDFAFNCKAFSNECIRESIENALRDVIKSTQGLAMTVEENSWNILSMSVVMESEMETNVPENVPNDCEMSIDENIVACTEEADKVFQLASDLRESEHDQEQSTTSGDEDTLENTTIEFQNDLNFKDFSSRIEKEDGGKTSRKTYKTGLFVTVKVNGKPVVIKKSSLCWLLDDTKGRVSTDRLRRFINNSKEAKTILL